MRTDGMIECTGIGGDDQGYFTFVAKGGTFLGNMAFL
jgi:hypothetical protein